MTDPISPSASYRESGVDIEAGDALVEAIKPAAKSTDRPGTMGALAASGPCSISKRLVSTILFLSAAPMASARS